MIQMARMDYAGLLSPSETMKLLIRIEHLPNRKLGQNFLVDANIVRKSLEFAQLEQGEKVVEIGPGLGTLTGAMLKSGAEVFAVELDKNLYSFLKDAFKDEKNLHLTNGDAVKNPLASLPPDVENFKIIANLPYAISTPWLDGVLSEKRLPKLMSLMLQKEAAQRFAAKECCKDYSPISIFLNAAYEAAPLYKVSANCFHPRPAVDSALLKLTLKETPYIFSEDTKGLIRRMFLKRRKQIGTIVRSVEAERAELAAKWLEKSAELGLSTQARPEAIPFKFWKLLDELNPRR